MYLWVPYFLNYNKKEIEGSKMLKPSRRDFKIVVRVVF